MRRWIVASAVVAIVGIGLAYWIWPSVHSKCIQGVCVGKPLPDLSAYGPSIRQAAQRADREIRIDLRSNPPFLDLPMFRPPIPTPPLAERVQFAELLIRRDGSGTVRHIRLVESYANGSILWGNHQKDVLRHWLRDNTGARASIQEINWQRKGILEQVDNIHGIRTLMQIWPGSGGFASLRVDVGYFDTVPEPEK